MNYRHAFHAGNFADLVKHAVLTRLLRDLTTPADPLTVIDTHAGAGLYDLSARESRLTSEGDAGVGRLMADKGAPGAFDALKAAVRRVNAPGQVRCYPGSPVLIAAALRPRDRYIACEVRADDHAALQRALLPDRRAVIHLGDGWAHAAMAAPAAPATLLLLVDPPFEGGDDYVQAVRLAKRVLGVNPAAVIAIWTPIKDLATFDSFLGDLEDVAGKQRILVAQARLQTLDDPMRLNGCAMVVVNPPIGLEDGAREIVDWAADVLGQAGAAGRVAVLQAAR
jgi:23S rRNA (adenine2030-N6)-methyltransferase